MTKSLDSSRRCMLKFLSGAPLLPLATGGGVSLLFSACGGSSEGTAATAQPNITISSVTFNAMAAPTLVDPAAMATTSVNSSLTINYNNGANANFALQYESFFITGAQVSDGKGGTILAGGYYDINNQPINDTSGSSPRQFFSDSPDGMSLIKLANPTVAGVNGNTVFAVLQFEYATRNLANASMYGLLPSPIAVLTLDQDKVTGTLTLVKYHHVDTSSVHGLWITCGASLSPWNTHLSSEEYEPDAALGNSFLASFSQNLYGNSTTANPYHYGHLPEVTVNPDGTGMIKKHYCLGRISHELVQVMPDERTVLMGDDATNGGAFMFIADTARDLSASGRRLRASDRARPPCHGSSLATRQARRSSR